MARRLPVSLPRVALLWSRRHQSPPAEHALHQADVAPVCPRRRPHQPRAPHSVLDAVFSRERQLGATYNGGVLDGAVWSADGGRALRQHGARIYVHRLLVGEHVHSQHGRLLGDCLRHFYRHFLLRRLALSCRADWVRRSSLDYPGSWLH